LSNAATATSLETAAGQASLVTEIDTLLNGCLGASPFPSFGKTGQTAPKSGRPVLLGLVSGVVYAVLFVTPFFVFNRGADGRLFWLSVYGSLYIAWATAIARHTSAKISQTIAQYIVPTLSKDTVKTISIYLSSDYAEFWVRAVSWSVGVVGFGLVLLAIYLDGRPVDLLVIWWTLGWLYLFVTAARTTYVARFYLAFSEALSTESAKLYALDPARSVLVKSISSISQSILLFWVGIASAILLIGPFIRLGVTGVPGALDWHIFLGFPTIFTLLVVPIVSICSLPFGTYVFIRSEHAIKSATDRVLNKTLSQVEQETNKLISKETELSESEKNRVTDLESVHRYLSKNGPYRNFFFSALSLIMPAVGIVVELVKLTLHEH
jgi:hypothetical protein